MIQAPSNRILVHPKSKYVGNLTNILKAASIENGSSVDPTDIVSITGEIVSLPKFISPTREYQGFSTKDMKVGDLAIFSYRVIYDHKMVRDERDELVAEHRNAVYHDGKEYFTANIRDVFGVIRNGEIIMVNGYVMVSEHEVNKILVPNYLKKIRGVVCSDVISAGSSRTHESNRFHVEQGDYVFYSPYKAQHYKINDKKFIILSMNHILGKKANP